MKLPITDRLNSVSKSNKALPVAGASNCKASRMHLRVQAISEATKSTPSQRSKGSSTMGPSPVSDIKNVMTYRFGKRGDYSSKDVYNGTAWSVRDRLMDSFDKTHEHWK